MGAESGLDDQAGIAPGDMTGFADRAERNRAD